LPLTHDKRASWPDDLYVQISEHSVSRALRTSRFKYIVTAQNANAWKDPFALEYTEAELYDLLADPYELNNRIGYESHQALTEVLRARLLARIKQAGEPEPKIISAPPVKSGQKKIYEHELHL